MQLKAVATNTTLATTNFTVILVNLSFRTGTTASVSIDNFAKAVYESNLGTANLGILFTTGTAPNKIWRTGVEIVATVQPSSFSQQIVLQRSRLGFAEFADQTPSLSGGFLPDTSGDNLRDDDPQSGGSAGHVYDLDAPGVGNAAGNPDGTILRFRSNFQQWATLNGVRISGDIFWFSRVSVIKTSVGDLTRNDLPGDNLAGLGSTALTWNFQP